MERPPYIVGAAMLMDDGLVIAGARHYSPEMRRVMKRIYGNGFKLFGIWIKKPYHMRVKTQGFIDNTGSFLDRKRAWKRAGELGQIRFVLQCDSSRELYSDNLY